MPGKPISVTDANDMITAYIDYMTHLGVDMNKQTQSVSFTSSTLMSWLNGVMPKADELRIFMGTYPPGHAQAGHTSVILWPYKDGQPLPSDSGLAMRGGGDSVLPFNYGVGNP
jgi:hypothetical protein